MCDGSELYFEVKYNCGSTARAGSEARPGPGVRDAPVAVGFVNRKEFTRGACVGLDLFFRGKAQVYTKVYNKGPRLEPARTAFGLGKIRMRPDLELPPGKGHAYGRTSTALGEG